MCSPLLTRICLLVNKERRCYTRVAIVVHSVVVIVVVVVAVTVALTAKSKSGESIYTLITEAIGIFSLFLCLISFLLQLST